MALLDVYADTRGYGTCRGCGSTVEWAELRESRKRMPFDKEIVPVRSYREEGTNRVVQVVDTTVSQSHFAVCPNADDFRKRK